MAFKQDHFLSLFATLERPQVDQFIIHLKGQFRKKSQPLKLFKLVRKTNQLKPKLAAETYAKLMSVKEEEEIPANRISKLFSTLNAHLKYFLLLQYLERNPIERELLWAQTMLLHEQKHAFDRHLSNAQKLIDNGQMSIDKYLLSFQVNLGHYFSPFVGKHSLKMDQIRKIIEELDEFYVSAKLKLEIELISRQAIFKETPVYNPFITFLRQPFLYPGQKLSNLYRKMYAQLLDKTDDSWGGVVKLWEDEISKVGYKNEQIYLLTLLLNINAQAINQGKPNAYHVQYDLLTIGIENKILTPNDVISPERFISLIYAACETNRIEMAQKHIKEWKGYIRPVEYTNEVVLLASARIEFAKKKFKNVVKMLDNQELLHPFSEYWHKCLVIRSNYELTNYDEAYQTCESFLRNMRRKNSNTTTEGRKKVVGKLAETNTKAFLVAVKDMANQATLNEKLKDKIKATEMAYKSWVLEKLKER